MILILNCGSQSIKWKIFDEKLRAVKNGKREITEAESFERVLAEEMGEIKEPVTLIGHRVVHGGGIFKKPAKITQDSLWELKKISNLAPLHNPYNVLGINICQDIFKDVPQFAVFDTEFYADMPEVAYTYALPEEISKEYKFRKYGFHGISHSYVSQIAAKKAKKNFAKARIISCHLGGGASVTAIAKGKAVDTSMGFTPLEGLVMMTRSGDIDPAVVIELSKEFSPERASEILNKESGVKGICGEGEMLEVLERVKKGDKKAKLALDIFVYRIKKYIGAYVAAMGGCDILVFTGAIGAGSPKIRAMITKDLKVLKIKKVVAIETDEELAIAQKISNLK